MRTLMTVVAIAVLLSVTGLCFGQTNGLLDEWGPTVASGFSSDYGGTPGTVGSNWSKTWDASTFSGIYDTDGWAVPQSTGPDAIHIAADIEMWVATSLDANNIYFHFGDTRGASESQIVDANVQCNNGMWLGISFPGGDLGKLYNKDHATNPTTCEGFILEGTEDVMGRDISGETLPVRIQMKDNDPWRYCEAVNDSPAAAPVWAIWWLVNNGDPGNHNYQFKFTANPTSYHADGHYELDPAIVLAPEL